MGFAGSGPGICLASEGTVTKGPVEHSAYGTVTAVDK